MHHGPQGQDLPKIEAAAAEWLRELGIERTTELTAIEQVELLIWGGHLPGREWAERSMSAIGEEWAGEGPEPRWSRLGQPTRKRGR